MLPAMQLDWQKTKPRGWSKGTPSWVGRTETSVIAQVSKHITSGWYWIAHTPTRKSTQHSSAAENKFFGTPEEAQRDCEAFLAAEEPS